MDGTYSHGDHEMFRDLYNSLLNTQGGDRPDRYFILKDFRSYAEAQKKVEEAYKDPDRWAKMALLNTASCGKFTSDRTIQEYVDNIWKLDYVTVKPECIISQNLSYSGMGGFIYAKILQTGRLFCCHSYITSVCGYDSAEWQKQFGTGQWDEPVCDRKK